MENLNNTDSKNNNSEFGSLEDVTVLDELPILPVRELVVYPFLKVPMAIPAQSLPVIQEALNGNKKIGLVTIKHDGVDDPKKDQVFETGTVATVVHAKKLKDGTTMVILNGLNRFRVTAWLIGIAFPQSQSIKSA